MGFELEISSRQLRTPELGTPNSELGTGTPELRTPGTRNSGECTPVVINFNKKRTPKIGDPKTLHSYSFFILYKHTRVTCNPGYPI